MRLIQTLVIDFTSSVRGHKSRSCGCHRAGRAGFTLVELLVVIAVIAILASLLLPALTRAKESGRKAACISNLRQIGIAIHNYSGEYDGRIPYGPTAPPFSHPADFYPSTGSPTTLLSLRSGAPVALGLLLKTHVSHAPRVFFCPGTDQPVDAQSELNKVGTTQAQGSYYYRHAGVTQLFHNPQALPDSTRLENPGLNRNSKPIRALAIDSQFLSAPAVETYNVKPRTHHRQKFANVLFYDSSVSSLPNRDRELTVDLQSTADLYDAFNRILQVFERADEKQ